MHLTIAQFNQQHADWAACRMIRQHVFIEEQQVPVALEWDMQDAGAIHVLGRVHGQPVACARVLPDGHIGRMAVLPVWRRQSIGAEILQCAVQICRDLAVPEAQLSAQVQAVGFYTRAGFVVVSEPYLDAGIPHVDMMLKLI